ncbi:MAG TPA: DUF6544 family protein [Armatimonadota bacterium]|nr:DUF6544 family protein [Armatimonadota bacterium]
MRSEMKAAAAIGLGAAGCAAALAARRWRSEAEGTVDHLFSRSQSCSEPVICPEDLAGVPAPVARYFEFVLIRGRPLIERVRVVERGRFRVGGLGAPWKPLTAVQYFVSDPPGFLWDARIRMAPFFTFQIRDSYLDGVGSTRGRAGSLIPVVNSSGTAELAAGALHRYLAESVWFPTALLPRQGLRWEPIDENRARAALTDAGVTVALDFRFGEDGAIVSAYTPGRYRDSNGSAVPTPWECEYGDYALLNGVMIPLNGKVEWLLPEGRLPYCQIWIRKIEYVSRV